MAKTNKQPRSKTERVKFPIVARHIKRLYDRLQEVQGWAREFIWHRYSNDPWDSEPLEPRLYVSYHTARAWSDGIAKPTEDEQIRRLAVDGIRLGRLDSDWLKNFLEAVDARTDLREAILREVEPDSPGDPEIMVIPPRASGIRVQRLEDVGYAVDKLNIAVNQRTLMLIGGASFMSDSDMQALTAFFEGPLVELCEELQLTVVDGATQAGIVQTIGQARAKAHAKFNLVGVAPFYSMRIRQNQRGGEELPELNHTHFVFSAGTKWEDASPILSAVASVIARQQPSVALLINGGGVAYLDALCSIWAGRPVIALEGSGRTADYFAAAMRNRAAHMLSVKMLLDSQLMQSVSMKDPDQIIATIRQCLI